MKVITLFKGEKCFVDDVDYKWAKRLKWHKSSYGYVVTKAWGRDTAKFMHRIILGLTDSKIYADHIDGNPLNNCRNNLRVCTNSQNQANSRKSTMGSSAFKGVCWDKERNKWLATIHPSGRTIRIGRFSTEKDAALAYDQKARELFGEFAGTNF